MRHDEFRIGDTFWCGSRQWRCTDIGTRTVVAIRTDQVTVDSIDPALRRTLYRAEAEADGWFIGPPYAVAEAVFDENDVVACTRQPEASQEHAG